MSRDLIGHVLDTRGLRAALMLKLRYIDGWTLAEIGTAFTDLGDGRGYWKGKRNGATLGESRMSQAMKQLLFDLRAEFAEAA